MSTTVTTKQARRRPRMKLEAVEANSIRADADALGQGTLIVYAGDFNMRSSSEAAFQKLISPGNGQALDPIGRLGTWHNNPSFVDVFTKHRLLVHRRFCRWWIG